MLSTNINSKGTKILKSDIKIHEENIIGCIYNLSMVKILQNTSCDPEAQKEKIKTFDSIKIFCVTCKISPKQTKKAPISYI